MSQILIVGVMSDVGDPFSSYLLQDSLRNRDLPGAGTPTTPMIIGFIYTPYSLGPLRPLLYIIAASQGRIPFSYLLCCRIYLRGIY